MTSTKNSLGFPVGFDRKFWLVTSPFEWLLVLGGFIIIMWLAYEGGTGGRPPSWACIRTLEPDFLDRFEPESESMDRSSSGPVNPLGTPWLWLSLTRSWRSLLEPAVSLLLPPAIQNQKKKPLRLVPPHIGISWQMTWSLTLTHLNHYDSVPEDSYRHCSRSLRSCMAWEHRAGAGS